MTAYQRGRFRFLQDCVVEDRPFHKGQVVTEQTRGLSFVALEALLATGRVARIVGPTVETKRSRP